LCQIEMAEHCQDILRGVVSQIPMAEHCQNILSGALSQIEMAKHCQDILKWAVISQIEMSQHCQDIMRGAVFQIKMAEHAQDILREQQFLKLRWANTQNKVLAVLLIYSLPCTWIVERSVCLLRNSGSWVFVKNGKFLCQLCFSALNPFRNEL